MRSRFLVVMVFGALAGSLIPMAASARTEPPERRVHDDAARRARDYWTSSRMRAAIPMPGPHGADGSTAEWVPVGSRKGISAPFTPRQGSEQAKAQEVPELDSLQQPLSTNGKVFLTDPVSGDNFVCSGTAVASANQSVVVTAGHCVFDSVFFSNWVFVPAYRDGFAPYGIWPALELRVPQEWATEFNLSYDVGTAVVAAAQNGNRLIQTVGGRAFAFNYTPNEPYDVYGYPAGPPFNGSRMYRCASPYDGADNPDGAGPSTMRIDCDMTGGSSGGGWIFDGALYSLISYSRASQPGKLFGPYFGDVAANLYQVSSASTAPGGSPSPTPSPTTSPTPSVSPSGSPEPSPSPSPSPTPALSPTPTPSPSSSPTPSPSPSPSPSESPSPEPSPRPEPAPSPAPTEEPPLPAIYDVTDGPDPFTPNGDGRKDKLRIRFQLARAGTVILNVRRKGRQIVRLVDRELLPSGQTVVIWNGRNEVGGKAPRGFYRYVIKVTPLGGEQVKAAGLVKLKR